MPTTQSDRVVFSHRATKRERRRGSRARFCLPDGTWHTYLNQAVPDERSIEESVCERCGHGYSACIESGDTLCCECKTEDIMHRASELENQGVAMGAGSVDRISQRMIYGFREPALATMRW